MTESCRGAHVNSSGNVNLRRICFLVLMNHPVECTAKDSTEHVNV